MAAPDCRDRRAYCRHRVELFSATVAAVVASLPRSFPPCLAYDTQNDSERGDEQGNNHANASFNGLCTTTEPSMPWLAVQSASSSARCDVGGTGCSCALS